MLKQYKVLVFIFQFLILFASDSYCQQGIEGKVTDERKEPLQSVTLNIWSKETGLKKIDTDIKGNFKLELPQEVYSVRATKENYEEKKVDGIKVEKGKWHKMEIPLTEIKKEGIKTGLTQGIWGYVRDEKDNLIKDIPVGIQSKDTLKNLASDTSGYFQVELPQGKYTVTVSTSDYKVWKKKIKVNNSKWKSIEIYLERKVPVPDEIKNEGAPLIFAFVLGLVILFAGLGIGMPSL